MSTERPQQTLDVLFGRTERRCLEMFAEAIELAGELAPGKWSVTHYQNDRVRLIVGSIVVCTLHPSSVWFALDKDCERSPEFASLDAALYWKWTPKHDFRVVPSRSGYYTPSTAAAYRRTWPKIKKMLSALIRKANLKYKSLRPACRRAHSRSFVDHLRETLSTPQG